MNEVATKTTSETKELLQQLDELREEQGISRSQLAQKMGILVQSLNATLDNRGGEPSMARVRAIAKALGFNLTFQIEKN